LAAEDEHEIVAPEPIVEHELKMESPQKTSRKSSPAKKSTPKSKP